MAIDSHIAASTIAMSVYNVIAFAGRPLTPNEIVLGLRKVFYSGLEVEDLIVPIDELSRRGWVFVDEDGALEIVDDQKRRIIRSRSREGFAYDEETGAAIGGWDGWTTECSGCPGVLLTDIAAQEALR